MVQTTEAVIERDLAEATKTREDLLTKRAELDEQIRAAEQRYNMLKHVQAVLQGRVSIEASTERKSRAPSSGRAPRGARAEIRNQIAELLPRFADGLSAEGINSELQAETKAQKQAIANVLSQMVKEGILTWGGRRQPYKLAPAKRDEEAA
jgi:hypothetical protein